MERWNVVGIDMMRNNRMITCCDQFSQLKVNYNTLQSVLTIKGLLQYVMISSDNLRSIIARYDQFLLLKVNLALQPFDFERT
jgi:hypothetical protein